MTRGSILIGTSSWTDPTLIKDGDFYPPGTNTAEGRLKFYASRFPLVEVDSTYYFPPSERNSELWIERTPADFTFNIKAYSLLTNHPTQPESLYGDIKAELPKELLDKRASTATSFPTTRSTRYGSGSGSRSTRCTPPGSSAPSCSSSRSTSRSRGRTRPTSRRQ